MIPDMVFIDALVIVQGSINFDLYAIVTSADPTVNNYPIISPCGLKCKATNVGSSFAT